MDQFELPGHRGLFHDGGWHEAAGIPARKGGEQSTSRRTSISAIAQSVRPP
jgi:hypothetical protein